MSRKFTLPAIVLMILLLDASSLFGQRVGRRRAATTVVQNKPEETRPGPAEKKEPSWFERVERRVENQVQNIRVSDVETRVEENNFVVDQAAGKSGQDQNLRKATEQSVKTKSINKEGITEAYPFLSADGLRLYFTTNREGGHGRLYISSRTSVNDPFGEPGPLSKNLTDPYYCGTLTADELTLYVAKDGDIYVSKRNKIGDEFSKPEKVEEVKNGWTFGPGISPDGRELVVTATPKGYNDEVNILFRKNNSGKFIQADILPSPEGMNAGPAQFSKDGLTLYCSLEQIKNNEEKLFCYRRNSLQDRFIDMEELPASLNIHSQCLQPTVNGDESILMYVVSNGGWAEDDIVLVNMAGKNSAALPEHMGNVDVLQKINTSNSRVYPNPFHNNVVFQLDQVPEEGLRFILYDISGRLIQQEQLTKSTTTIQLDKLITGTYVFHVMNRGGKIISSGKLVRN